MPTYTIHPNPDSPMLFDLYEDGVLYQGGIGNENLKWLEPLVNAANARGEKGEGEAE